MLRDHSTMVSQIGYFHKIIGVDDKVGFFTFGKICQLSLDDRDPEEFIIRCDNGKIGPYGFHSWNFQENICSCGSTEQPDAHLGHHLITMENMSIVCTIMDFYPHIMILYFELKDPQYEELSCQNPHSESCRTLQELFRLILEWHYAYEIYGNREEIAEACHKVIIENMIPEYIQNWLLESVPPQKVERFLLGDINARYRQDIDQIQDLSIEFDNWLENKILNKIDLNRFEEIIDPLI